MMAAIAGSSAGKPGEMARTRAMNSSAAAAASRGASGHSDSPAIARLSRLVARIRRSGQRASRSPASQAAPAMTCSQLSRTTSAWWPDRNSASRSPVAVPVTPSAAATAWGTAAASPAEASSASHAPSRYWQRSSRATSTARRVLPTPPRP